MANGIMDRLRDIKERISQSEDLKEGVEDKVLISLRNQRQRQLNIVEKKNLRQNIKHFNKIEFRTNMGLTQPKKKILHGKFNKKDSILIDKNPLMKLKPKKVRNILGK